MRRLVSVLLVLAVAACAPAPTVEMATAPIGRPNIVLLVFEDMSERVGAFGDPVANTPVLDAFATEAIRLPNTFTTAGVCAPSRSALITGVHQQTMGTQNMRTRGASGLPGGGPIEYDAVPPAEIKAFPELLRRAGYYTTNNVKTDYQFGEPFTVWDRNTADADWRGRAPGQPFFTMINIYETHESYIWPEDRQSDSKLIQLVTARNKRDLAGKERVTDPAAVVVPPWLPDTSIVRADIARHYDNILFAEHHVADVMAKLKADGLLDSTVVIVTTDHGDGFPRAKRTVYDAGLKVPTMVRFPDGRGWGTVDDRLVSFVDLAPTILRLAGAPVPKWVQGQQIFGAERDFIYAAADRHDEVPGRSKAVRDGRYKYIRNYVTSPVLEPLAFRDALPTMQEIWRLSRDGALTAPVAALLRPRPAEELYDVGVDPAEVRNLAADPALASVLRRMRTAMDRWIARTGDRSEVLESQMIAAMWPGLIQPVTVAPTIQKTGDRLALTSATPGASLGWRVAGEDGWRIYSGPFVPPTGAAIEAKAIRYGFAESAISTR